MSIINQKTYKFIQNLQYQIVLVSSYLNKDNLSK